MKNDVIQSDEHPVGQWWLLVVVGVVSVAVGFLVLVNPAASYFALSMWFGVAILLSGVMGLIVSLSSRNYYVRRGWLIVASIIDIIIGITLVFNFALSVLLLPVLFAGWLLYRGAVTMVQGLDMRSSRVSGAGWVIFGALMMILLALAALWLPESLGAEVVVMFVAIAFIVYGVSQISLGTRLAEVHRRAKALM